MRKESGKDKTITKVDKKPGDTHFRTGLMKVKQEFLYLGSFILQTGTQIRL